MTTYQLAAPVPESLVKELAYLDPLLRQLLYRRGLTARAEIDVFLSPDFERDLHAPELLPGMPAAVRRIEEALAANERIVIFSDYDCDGIPGGVILHDLFRAIGYKHFSNYIPHRHYEGFGLSVEAVEKLAAEGAALIITIDCGTGDVAAVERANELGVDVVITDHHEPNGALPDAAAIVSPKLGEYPFPHLCGSAVVFKLAQALIAAGSYKLVPGTEKWWLDMVGIATVADMVPLTGENRALAHFGLVVLRKSRRPGLQQLLRKVRANQAHLTEDDIGFTLGPRINAASRMDTPEDAFFLLASTDEGEAGARVNHLEQLNQKRKTTIAGITRDIHKRMKEVVELPDVIVMGDVSWRPSLVGLAANKLAEEYRRPVFLWGRDGKGVIKGSCRTYGEVSVVKLMEAAKDLFIEFGGHHASGGFSVSEAHMFTFGGELNAIYAAHGHEVAVREPEVIDAYVSLSEPLDVIVNAQTQLAPFGFGNPKPLYGFQEVVPARVEQFGKGKEHLKLVFDTPHGPVEALAFFATEHSFQNKPETGRPVTLLAHVEQSYFMNRQQTRLRIVDIL